MSYDTLAIVTKHRVDEIKGESTLDAMVEAQREYGQITWTELDTHQAKGFYVDPEGNKQRIAAMHPELADAMQALLLASWVHGNIA